MRSRYIALLLLLVLTAGLILVSAYHRDPSNPSAGLALGVDDPAESVIPRQSVFGLTIVTDEDDRMPLSRYQDENGSPPERLIVLVHGLDDPGWMWRDVIPALRGAGHIVARMEYPNDGPIADSADQFAQALVELRADGVQRVDIVAHSMGGLVTRDALTRQAHYAGDGSGGDRFPAIDRFIMCGTPNHGSKLARLRAISEIKEHITRAFSGEGSWLGSLADGNGEAAVDLLPDSDFLRDLNDRPLASHTLHTIIAGRMSPVAGDELGELGRRVKLAAAKVNAPAWLRDWIDSTDEEAGSLLSEAVQGIGDGCVAINSARLNGVDDFLIVEANHVSMIVNYIKNHDETPPAVPIILDRLGEVQ